MELKTGTLLHGGTYRILNASEIIPQHKYTYLGQGSFGITYLAEHTSLGRKVAIKEFFMKELNSRGEDGSISGMTDGSLSYNYGQKFKKEAMNLSQLDHPNIVRVTDSFEENGTYYYVMDYIEGKNLNDYLKHNAVSQQEAINIITDVAKALQYMHDTKHMLHLDLKPGNIMRRASDGHIFLIDFGLSKHFSSSGQPETSTTIGLGTPGYAPIEQSNQAKNGEFRPTIDVYALGATLYKLLTRETPPPASDIVSDDELLEDKLRAYGISGNIIDVVVNAMLPNVKKRIHSVNEFAKLISVNENDSRINALADIDESTSFISEPAKPAPKKEKKSKPLSANKKQQEIKNEEIPVKLQEPVEDNPEMLLSLLPKEKFGLWLKVFLFVICYCGLGSIFAPFFHWNYFDQNREIIGYGLVIFGVLQFGLALLTINAFRKRKPDAVFLGKLSTIIICVADLLYVLSNCDGSVGIARYAPFVRGVVTAIVWFVYLCVSKRVEAVIPSVFRKTLKRDYIICAFFAITAIYLFITSEVVSAFHQAETIENINGNRVVNQKFKDSNGETYTYTGEIHNGLPNGIGEGVYSFGKYIGPYKDGLMHGADGKFTEKGGATFVGSFDNDYYSEGTLTRTDGTYFVGKMKDGVPSKGTEYNRHGKVIKCL